MVAAINNSTGVLAALKALQSANQDLSTAEARTSSTLKVATARDNPIAYQGSAVMNGEVSSLKAVSLSLGRAQSVSDVAIAAGSQISDLLIQMKATATSAMGADLSSDQREAFNLQFQQQRSTLINFVQNASFDNANVLNGSKPNGVSFVADADATQTLSLKGRDFLPGGPVVTISTQDDLSSPDAAQHAFEKISASIANVSSQLAEMGQESKRIEAQTGFVSKLSDALTGGVGRLVDADLAGDSALIQALQVKQSLSAQAISIANNAPQSLLALFRPS
ncbi:MAG: flagellin [Alphaproteobacteria bacterium]